MLLEDQGLVLPVGALHDRRFKGMTAEEIYESIATNTIERKSNAICPHDSQHLKASGKWQDTHLEAEDLRCSDLRPMDALDEEGRRGLRYQLTSDMREHLPGSIAGYHREEIARARGRRIDWQGLLRVWLTECFRNDWRSIPYSKKALHRGIFLPSLGVQAPSHILFAVDTSGSISTTDLAKAFSEIELLRAAFPCSLTRIQCDARIQEIKEFEAFETADLNGNVKVFGRGGTDFRPIFTYLDELKKNYPFVITIIITDGFGEFPKTHSNSPLLWVLNKNSIDKDKIPFGRVIVI